MRRSSCPYNSASQTMREAGIVQKQGEPFFEINAADARLLELEDGDWARLSTRRGSLEAKARVGDRVREGVVWMAFHFAAANANWLTNAAIDPRTGTPEYKVCAVCVEPLRRDQR